MMMMMMMKWTNRYEKKNSAFRKGSKRKRTQHECDVCEKVFRYPSLLANTCVLTRTRDRTSVMFAIKLFVNLVVCKSTCAFTRTRNRTSAMCAKRDLVELILCKPTCVFTRTRNRMNVMYARWSFVIWVLWKGTSALNISCSFVVLKVYTCTS